MRKLDLTRSLLSSWTAANIIAGGLGFPLAIILQLLSRGADLPTAIRALSVTSFDRLPSVLRDPDFNNPGELAAGVVAGIFVASCQAVVLRGRVRRLTPYVLAPAVAWVILFLAVVGPLMLAGRWGRIPGPVEPMVVTLGGAPLTAIVQWFVLRRQGVNATRWFALFVAAAPVAWVLLLTLGYAIENVMGTPIPWGLELLLFGTVLGGTAGTMTRSAMEAALLRIHQRQAPSNVANG